MRAPERLPPIDPADYDAEQRRVAADFKARRGYEPFGPYRPLLRSPGLMLEVEAVGRRLRHGSCLPEDLKELAICLVARSFSQDFEWSVHVREAEAAGVSRAVLDQIAAGRRPDGMSAGEALIHDATAELIATKRWSDATYSAIHAAYGERGAVEIPALVGIYSLLAYVLNVARTPPDGEGLPRFPE